LKIDETDFHITTASTTTSSSSTYKSTKTVQTTGTTSVDVTRLHAKIGELSLERDFLESALSKAGLLGAKR